MVCSDANSKRDECFIGVLTDEAIKEMEKDSQRAAESFAQVKEARKGLTLQPDSFTHAILIRKTIVSNDTRCAEHLLFLFPSNSDACFVGHINLSSQKTKTVAKARSDSTLASTSCCRCTSTTRLLCARTRQSRLCSLRKRTVPSRCASRRISRPMVGHILLAD